MQDQSNQSLPDIHLNENKVPLNEKISQKTPDMNRHFKTITY